MPSTVVYLLSIFRSLTGVFLIIEVNSEKIKSLCLQIDKVCAKNILSSVQFEDWYDNCDQNTEKGNNNHFITGIMEAWL